MPNLNPNPKVVWASPVPAWTSFLPPGHDPDVVGLARRYSESRSRARKLPHVGGERRSFGQREEAGEEQR